MRWGSEEAGRLGGGEAIKLGSYEDWKREGRTFSFPNIQA